MIVPFILALVFFSWSGTFEELEKRLEKVNTLRAHFIQKTIYTWYPKPDISEGLFISIRGKGFRIDYLSPERVTITSHSGKTIVYNHEDKEALVSESDQPAVVESLLFFSKPLSEVFSLKEERKEGSYRILELVPKKESKQLVKLRLYVDGSMRVKKVVFWDSEGTETILEFKRLEENVPVTEDQLRLELPKDAHIQRVNPSEP